MNRRILYWLRMSNKPTIYVVQRHYNSNSRLMGVRLYKRTLTGGNGEPCFEQVILGSYGREAILGTSIFSKKFEAWESADSEYSEFVEKLKYKRRPNNPPPRERNR